MHCPFGHPVSIMLPIYLYKIVKFLNGINAKHKAAWKKYWTMVFNRIAVHMQQFGQIRATSKNGLKFDISRLCSQPFNYSHLPHFTWASKINDKIERCFGVVMTPFSSSKWQLRNVIQFCFNFYLLMYLETFIIINFAQTCKANFLEIKLHNLWKMY